MTKLAGITTPGLVPYGQWKQHIEALKTHTHITEENQAAELLTPALEKAVERRIPKQPFGIFFSGGVDSTLIAWLAKQRADFTCYTVGMEGAKDVIWARKAARKLGFNHKVRILSLEEMESLFEETAAILGPELIDVVNIGVGSVVLATIQLARQDSISTFFTGLGSEEIFAGYQRHDEARDINEECWAGLLSMWKRDFRRDVAIAEHKDATFLTPFLDTDLIRAAMQIDGTLKIKGGYKKYILRKAALRLGLPKEFAMRPKKAAQYGSKFDKALLKIAKSKGYRYKKPYLTELAD